MISFIVSAVILVLIAVVFIVPTLLKKNHPFSDEYDDLNVEIAKDRLQELKVQLEADEINQQTYQQLRDELESTLAEDLSNVSQPNDGDGQHMFKENKKLVPIILAVAVPIISTAIYYQLGDINAATGTNVAETVIPAGDNRPQMTMEEAVVKLEQRLMEQPDNADGWFMLAKTYMTMSQYQKAVTAYEKVISLAGEKPEVLLRYADAIAMSEGGSLTGKAKPIVDKVISMIPNNPTVLWMAGSSEVQQKNYAKALSYWYKLQPMLSQDATAQTQIKELINNAETQLTADEIAQIKRAAPVAKTQVTEVGAGNVKSEIVVTVDLDPALKDKVSANDTLFIFAKAMQGPPMPLAAVKKTVAALPLTVSLNDAMAMMPQMKLSNFEQVRISAVVSKSGQPGTQAGDLFAEVSPVNVKSQEKINLIINQTK